MSHLSRTLPPLMIALAAAACFTDSRQGARKDTSAVSNSTSPGRSADVVRYHGDGFDIELPPGSAIGRGAGTDTLRGPAVVEAGRSPDMGGPGPHPRFLLEVSILPNPARTALDVWADSAWREAGKGADEIAEPGPLEKDTIGVAPAFAFEPYCGDCESRVTYVARDDKVVRLKYDKGIHLAGTREQQEAAYRVVLATFRWSQADSVDTSAARDEVLGRYEAHFHGGQAFSVDTLRARKSWFTPELYRLLEDDLNASREISYIDFDPFTNAQDDAARFDVGTARVSHDTVYVDVDLRFGAGDTGRVTLAMLPTPNGWAIADFIYPDSDLAVELRKAKHQEVR
jgi:hypothetical protein